MGCIERRVCSLDLLLSLKAPAAAGVTTELAEAMRTLGAVNAVSAAASRAAVLLPPGDAPPRGPSPGPRPGTGDVMGQAAPGARADAAAAAAPADQGKAGQGGAAGSPAGQEGGRTAALSVGGAIAEAALGWRISLVSEGAHGRCTCTAGHLVC